MAGSIIVAAGGGTIIAVSGGGTIIAVSCGIIIAADGGDSDFAAGGGWLGRRGNDFSADLTDVNDGSSTFALRSALLEAHFRASPRTAEPSSSLRAAEPSSPQTGLRLGIGDSPDT